MIAVVLRGKMTVSIVIKYFNESEWKEGHAEH